MFKNLWVTTLLFFPLLGHGQASGVTQILEGNKPVFIALEYGLETKGNEDIRFYWYQVRCCPLS